MSSPTVAVPPGEIGGRAMTRATCRPILARMETGSHGSVGRTGRRYQITVRGELTQPFLEPLDGISVEPKGTDTILICEVVDRAKLQAVLSWLYAQSVEIVSVGPDDGGPESVNPPSSQQLPGRHAP